MNATNTTINCSYVQLQMNKNELIKSSNNITAIRNLSAFENLKIQIYEISF